MKGKMFELFFNSSIPKMSTAKLKSTFCNLMEERKTNMLLCKPLK